MWFTCAFRGCSWRTKRGHGSCKGLRVGGVSQCVEEGLSVWEGLSVEGRG